MAPPIDCVNGGTGQPNVENSVIPEIVLQISAQTSKLVVPSGRWARWRLFVLGDDNEIA
jgi:hypothetical protein